MLKLPAANKNEPKCSVTHGSMGYIDPKQPPVKRKPFAAIFNRKFVQRAELILPEELIDMIKRDILIEKSTPSYSRVILPLRSLLEGDFFNEYIKKGNILMLSEGRIGLENVYLLRDGHLTLHLDKESYERAGLVGKPDGAKGSRGTKPRWVVDIDLRQPSMLHGKKGFDRIVYAFKNTLTTPVTWLFCDLEARAPTPDPLGAHFPSKKSVSPDICQISVTMPLLKPPTELDTEYGSDFEDYAEEMYEWLSMVMLNSPRVNPNDNIDSIISRYAPPGNTVTEANLVKIVWRGFLSPAWAHKTFVQVLLALPQNTWFAYSVFGFGEGLMGHVKACTILTLPNTPNEYILWEIE